MSSVEDMTGENESGKCACKCICGSSFQHRPTFIHSFIYTEHLYSASSRELLRGAPDSSTAKKSSLKLRKKLR